MIAVLCVLGALLGLAVLPVGVRACYGANGALLQLKVGPLYIKLYPENKSSQENKTATGKEKSGKQASSNSTNAGGGLNDLLPILRVVWDLLRDFKRKLRVDRLEFKLVLAGEDPCDLSVNYGRAWAALGNLMPRLERSLTIRRRNLEVECDYLAERTTVFLLVDLTITVGRLFGLAANYGLRGLIEYRKLLKIRKGGA